MMAFKVEATVPRAEDEDNELNGLVDTFSKAGIKEGRDSKASNDSENPKSKKLIPEHITGGKVAEYDFIEIKTMAQRKEMNWAEFYPQLMLSNNRSVYAARHFRGQFVSIDKYDVGEPSLKKYEEDTNRVFGQLLEFLRRLLVTLKQPQSGTGPWSLVYIDGVLKLHKLEKDVLSPDEISLFD